MSSLSKIHTNIVLIADRTFKKSEESDIDSNKLEMVCDEYFYDIITGLEALVPIVYHYNNPQDFINKITDHKNDIVFSIYGGYGSRNRMALVPAICESYNINFVGADAYSRILCQDKQMTKEFIKRFDLHTPEYILIDDVSQIELVKTLNFPIIIKPNLEGSSIGIDKNSIIKTYEEAYIKIIDFLYQYNQPILAEEFIGGREINICITGTLHEINCFQIIETVNKTEANYFESNVFSAYDKHVSDDFELKAITDDLDKNTLDSLKIIFKSLGKVDYLRIDGKLNHKKLSLIELTPDGYLGKDSSFAKSFQLNNKSYEIMLNTIINNALSYYRIQYSNGIKN